MIDTSRHADVSSRFFTEYHEQKGIRMSLTDIVGSMIVLLCVAAGYGGYLIGCWQTRKKCRREEQKRIARMEPSHAVVTTEMLRAAEWNMFNKFIAMTGTEVIKSPARQKSEREAKRRGERDPQ